MMRRGYMIRFNTVEEFAQYTDVETLLDIQKHVNKALEEIREDSLKHGPEGTAVAKITLALPNDLFLLIEFNYNWENEIFEDEEEAKLTILGIDEWLDFYNENKEEFSLVSVKS
jgi:hypothetical protein